MLEDAMLIGHVELVHEQGFRFSVHRPFFQDERQ
jgi:hypothetical protein